MYTRVKIKSIITAAAVLACQQSLAQNAITVPAVSVESASHVGLKVHAHLRVVTPPEGQTAFASGVHKETASTTAPYSGYGFQTPSSIACIYGLVTQTNNCNPSKTTLNVAPHVGAAKAIALVDAYHYPYALSDLKAFSNQFGLPAPNLQVVYASGTQPATDPGGWEVEEALDLQWAHAMAPNAKLFLVEAANNSTASLLQAVKAATALVQAAGGGAVSMSWGSSEFSGETTYDSYFNNANVIYFASSGDSAGVSWPCVSQNVICVGGTSLRLYGAGSGHSVGDFDQEVAWADGGGGISAYAAKPAYQNNAGISGNFRGVPDVALAADPNSGAWIYYTPSNNPAETGWWVIGGTSWASPMAAGITVNSGTTSSSTAVESAKIYTSAFATDFTDTKSGWCGPYYGLSTATGWDPCTGLGSYHQY